MHKSVVTLACLAGMVTPSVSAMQVGVNYNDVYVVRQQCPATGALTALMPSYSQYRSTVQSQLEAMHNNGLEILRVFAKWGNNYSAAASGSFTGALIAPPTIQLPQSYVNSVVLFLQDARGIGFSKVILTLNGVGA